MGWVMVKEHITRVETALTSQFWSVMETIGHVVSQCVSHGISHVVNHQVNYGVGHGVNLGIGQEVSLGVSHVVGHWVGLGFTKAAQNLQLTFQCTVINTSVAFANIFYIFLIIASMTISLYKIRYRFYNGIFIRQKECRDDKSRTEVASGNFPNSNFSMAFDGGEEK